MDGYETIKLFGCGAIKLLVAHGPWSVSLVDFQPHVLFSLLPHITVPILAVQRETEQEKERES